MSQAILQQILLLINNKNVSEIYKLESTIKKTLSTEHLWNIKGNYPYTEDILLFTSFDLFVKKSYSKDISCFKWCKGAEAKEHVNKILEYRNDKTKEYFESSYRNKDVLFLYINDNLEAAILVDESEEDKIRTFLKQYIPSL